jgi:hypothetical protein
MFEEASSFHCIGPMPCAGTSKSGSMLLEAGSPLESRLDRQSVRCVKLTQEQYGGTQRGGSVKM